MLHPEDIARLCQRKYPGFLQSVVTGEPFFPLDIRFGRPSTTEEWDTLRAEIAALASANLGYRIQWTQANTRRWGMQAFPERVWFETESEFLRAIQKGPEVERLRAGLALARAQLPGLEPWLVAHAAKLIEFADAWPHLLALCRYFLDHPCPEIYAREVPVSPDSKFIDRHKAVLGELLEFLLPDSAKRPAERFEERFGLRYDEPLVRLRLLDPALQTRLRLAVTDLAIPLSQFRALEAAGLTILIVENKMTFLTLPPIPEALGVWGGGGAAELLTSVSWLARGRLFYWGDLDVHGFHILSRLRRTFEAIQSLMMDESTLDQFAPLGIPARAATYEDVSGLTADERKAYERVRAHSLLLEQERIPHGAVLREVRAVVG